MSDFLSWLKFLSFFLTDIFTLVADGEPLSRAVERVGQRVKGDDLSYGDMRFERFSVFPDGLSLAFLWRGGLPFELVFYLGRVSADERWRAFWSRSCREVVGRAGFLSFVKKARDLNCLCETNPVEGLFLVRELVLRALRGDEDRERFLRARPEFTRVEWEKLLTDERFVKAMKDGLRDLVGGGESEFWEYAKEERWKREIDLTSVYYPIAFANEKIAEALSLLQNEAVSFLRAPFVLKIKQMGVLAKRDTGFSERLKNGLFFLLVLWFVRVGVLDEEKARSEAFRKALQDAILGMFSLQARVGSLKEEEFMDIVSFLYTEGLSKIFELEYYYSDPFFTLISQDMLFCHSLFVKLYGAKKVVPSPNTLPVMLLRLIRTRFYQDLRQMRGLVSLNSEVRERRLYHELVERDEFYCESLEEELIQDSIEEHSQEEAPSYSIAHGKTLSLVSLLKLLAEEYLRVLVKDLTETAPVIAQTLKDWFALAKPSPQEIYRQLRKTSEGKAVLNALKLYYQNSTLLENDTLKDRLFSAIERSLLKNLHTLIGRSYLLKKYVGYENLNPAEGLLLDPLMWFEYDLNCYRKALKQTINTLDKFLERRRAKVMAQKGGFTPIDHLAGLSDFVNKHALITPPKAFVFTSKIDSQEKLRNLLSHLK